MGAPAVGERRRALRVRRIVVVAVVLIAGTMLGAWLLGLDAATRTDDLAPMSPLTCLGFLAAAVGVWLLPARTATVLGVLTALCGLVGLADVLFSDGAAFNRAVFGVDAPISVFTAATLAVLGAATAIDGRNWGLARRMALVAGAVGGAAAIGFLLGVPWFYGPMRSIGMSWQAALCSLLTAYGLACAHPGPLFGDGLSGRFARTTIPAVVGIPVLAGALVAAGARSELWSFTVAVWLLTLAAVAGLAGVVAMAVRRMAEDDRRLNELAIRDPLTGAYNRRHFVAQAQQAALRARRYGEGGAIAVVDLDRFKEVNDRWGHAAGDETLVRSYRALRSRLRSSDVLGRIGGDEFAAVILHVGADEAQQVAQELRDAVRMVSSELTAEGRPNRLAASVGLALLDGELDVEELLEQADQRMYEEKRLTKQVQSGTDH